MFVIVLRKRSDSFRSPFQQEETERRYQEQLREISRKAFEMSVLKASTEDTDDAPALEPYASKKWCRACQTMVRKFDLLWN